MDKLKGKVALIAPNSYISDLARKISKEYDNILDIYEGNLEEGVKAAKKALANGSEVIISRGGTALMIEEELNITVVPITFSAYDLVRTLAKANFNKNSIGIIGYKNLIGEINGIENMMGCRIYFTEIKNHKEIEEKMLELYKRFGIQVFIGGEAVVKVAEDLGLKGILMDCGVETIRRSIAEGIRIARIMMEKAEKSMQFRAISDYSNEGIILLDEKNRVTYINPVGQKILMSGYEEIIEVDIKKFIAGSKLIDAIEQKKQLTAEYDQINSIKAIVNYIPLFMNGVQVGSIISIHDITRIEELERKIRKEQYAKGLTAKYTFNDILTNNEKMKKLINTAKRIAKTESTILITGESGTGKELIAQSIHNESLRKNGPFVAVNCASLPRNLLESELFGYVDGAFTGAKKGGKPGLFELAHMGTIFLDEVADMPLDLQAHLLRVIQEKELTRIGDDKVIPVNIRIISATNKDLQHYVSEGRFREDLYYRLNVLNIKMPPLRERQDDIPLLVSHFSKEYCAKNNLGMKKFSPDAISVLCSYLWPGNIRELQNFVEHLVLTVDSDIICENDVYELLGMKLQSRQALESYIIPGIKVSGGKSEVSSEEGTGILDMIEKENIIRVLKEVNGNRKKAARILGISTTTLWRKLKRFKDSSTFNSETKFK
ncbi:sigma 54-interacting transcriptional regulator [Thermoanaerobacterium sp. DL9XJH110]|uniref:sigma 54-interacting transcriptional regulator n=1 Tax=Thermoanaerobacterium sp. DL9XJH110 TaxID=3386643 RepID=UPI003BB68AE7